jgi:transposase-like protein
MPNEGPQTLTEAVRHFSDLDVCHEYMRSVKWPDGNIVCPKCRGAEIGTISSRRMLQCRVKECRKQFSCKVGTVFEGSPLGFDKWFVAVWCIANAKNGISSSELALALGVSQSSAWFMLHRIRLAMKAGGFNKMESEVECVETFVERKAASMHTAVRARKIMGRGTVGKAIVHGLERGKDGEPR